VEEEEDGDSDDEEVDQREKRRKKRKRSGLWFLGSSGSYIRKICRRGTKPNWVPQKLGALPSYSHSKMHKVYLNNNRHIRDSLCFNSHHEGMFWRLPSSQNTFSWLGIVQRSLNCLTSGVPVRWCSQNNRHVVRYLKIVCICFAIVQVQYYMMQSWNPEYAYHFRDCITETLYLKIEQVAYTNWGWYELHARADTVLAKEVKLSQSNPKLLPFQAHVLACYDHSWRRTHLLVAFPWSLRHSLQLRLNRSLIAVVA